jgi:hypothetical protein
LPLTALDRLVSVSDYAAFATTFAGIAKAAAVRLSDGRRQVVHVTVAGVDDGPLAPDGDVLTNLPLAFHGLGDPLQPVVVEHRELLVLVMKASVRLDPDYGWEFVEPVLRSVLLDRFGFNHRQLGQDVTSSEVLAAMASVPGVIGVDLDVLDSISENTTPDDLSDQVAAQSRHDRIPVASARIEKDDAGRSVIRPGQLALLLASVPDTLVLEAPWS